MALYLREGAEESNIRGLVESCAHNDDITPLIKLVFEAQSLADTTPSIAGACTLIGGDLWVSFGVAELCATPPPAAARLVLLLFDNP